MARNVREVLGGKNDDDTDQGMGTPHAEYGEDGPYHCMDCWFLRSRDPRSNPLGYCNEPHMLADPKTAKTTVDGKRVAVVNKEFGCCRFVDPVKLGEPRGRFVFSEDLDEEAEEHEEETPSYGDGGIVKKTGLAIVHKGEKVIPADEVKAGRRS